MIYCRFCIPGHITFDRFTLAQREEDKRLRQLERTANNASLPANLIRTKNPRTIRHTVWKTRGEEYRRLGGDGWMWLSATRGNCALQATEALSIHPPISHLPKPQLSDTQQVDSQTCRISARRCPGMRGLQHGIGWGVCPEYLQVSIPS